MSGSRRCKARGLRGWLGAAVIGALGAAVLPGSAAAAVLWEQDEMPTTSVNSAKHDPANKDFDSQLADDFLVAAGDGVTVTSVYAQGVYGVCGGPAGPAGSVNVFFYGETFKDGFPVPQEVAEASRANLLPSSGLPTGEFEIPIDPPVSLEPGPHWLAVQPNHNCAANGTWRWLVAAHSTRAQAAFRNPAEGLIPGCPTFTPADQCFGSTYDALFRIEGTVDPVVVALDASIAKNKAKKLLVTAGCGNEACDVTVGGKGSAKPAKGSSATTSAKKKKLKFKVKEQTASVAANATTTLQLKFKKHGKTVKKIKRLIKKKDGKAKVTLNASAIDSAGATDSQKLKKKLKP